MNDESEVTSGGEFPVDKRHVWHDGTSKAERLADYRETLAARDAEIKRLRELVGDAYAEGYEMGVDYGDRTARGLMSHGPSRNMDGWRESDACKALETTNDE